MEGLLVGGEHAIFKSEDELNIKIDLNLPTGFGSSIKHTACPVALLLVHPVRSLLRYIARRR